MTNDSKRFRFSLDSWLLLLFAFFFATVTGIFLASPSSSPLIGMSGLAIASLFTWMVCRFRRNAIWIAIGISVLLAIASQITNQWDSISAYLLGMTLSLNFLLFGELCIRQLRLMNHQQVFIQVAGLFVGGLSLGWTVAFFFG